MQTGKNRFEFYEKSQNHTVPPIEQSTAQNVMTDDGFDFENDTMADLPMPQKRHNVLSFDIEINKKDNATNNEINKEGEPTDTERNFMDYYWNGFCYEKIPREGEEKDGEDFSCPPCTREFVF